MCTIEMTYEDEWLLNIKTLWHAMNFQILKEMRNDLEKIHANKKGAAFPSLIHIKLPNLNFGRLPLSNTNSMYSAG